MHVALTAGSGTPMTHACPRGHASTDADYCSECGTPIAAPRVLDPAPRPAATGDALAECPDCMTPRTPGARFCEVCRHDFDADVPAAPPPEAVPATVPPAPMPVRVAPAPSGPAVSVVPTEPAAHEAPDVGVLGPTAGSDDQAAIMVADVPDATAPAVTEAPSDAAAPGDAPAAAPHRFRDPWAVVTCDRSLAPDDPTFPSDEPVRSFPLDLDGMTVGRRRSSGANPEVPVRDPAVSSRHLRIDRAPGGGLRALDVGSSNGTVLGGTPMEPGVALDLAPGDELTLGIWTRIRIEDR